MEYGSSVQDFQDQAELLPYLDVSLPSFTELSPRDATDGYDHYLITVTNPRTGIIEAVELVIEQAYTETNMGFFRGLLTNTSSKPVWVQSFQSCLITIDFRRNRAIMLRGLITYTL